MYKLGTGVKLQMIRYFPLDILDSLGPGFQLIESLVSWKNSIMLTLSIMFGEALWGIEGANFQKYSSVIRRGTWGVLNTATPQKNFTNTASPQEKSTKHRHHKSATRIFSAMIRSSTLKVILLYLNNFPQNKHSTTLFIAQTSILLMPVLNHLVVLFSRRNLARRKRMKEKRRGHSCTFFYLAHFSWCNPLIGAD